MRQNDFLFLRAPLYEALKAAGGLSGQSVRRASVLEPEPPPCEGPRGSGGAAPVAMALHTSWSERVAVGGPRVAACDGSCLSPQRPVPELLFHGFP